MDINENISTLFMKHYKNKDWAKCKELYNEIIKLDDPSLIVRLAWVYMVKCHKYGENEKQNSLTAKSITVYDNILNSNDPKIMVSLYRLYFWLQGGLYEKSLNLLKAASKVSYAKAFYFLYKESSDHKYLEEAARLGYHRAYNALGVYYLLAEHQKAKTYFKKAAKLGNVDAMGYLAKIYYDAGNKLSKAIFLILQCSKSPKYKCNDMLRILADGYEILEKENKILKTQLDFQPGGEGYKETERHFESLINKND